MYASYSTFMRDFLLGAAQDVVHAFSTDSNLQFNENVSLFRTLLPIQTSSTKQDYAIGEPLWSMRILKAFGNQKAILSRSAGPWGATRDNRLQLRVENSGR